MTLTPHFYWLPFPGMWQCVLRDETGGDVAEGMGTSKVAAQEAAEANA